jgi:hypothetical protein
MHKHRGGQWVGAGHSRPDVLAGEAGGPHAGDCRAMAVGGLLRRRAARVCGRVRANERLDGQTAAMLEAVPELALAAIGRGPETPCASWGRRFSSP